MPIPLKEYHDGLNTEETRILAILERQPYEAHDLEDLLPDNKDARLSNVLFSVVQIFGLDATLTGLVQKGLVNSKVVGGTMYFISSKAVP
jgi:hypothetical protein